MSGGIALRPFARIRVEVAPPVSLGMLDGAERRMVSILGGTVEGVHLHGKVLAGGNDIQSVRADGSVELVARYALDLGTAGMVMVENSGARRPPAADQAGDQQALPYFRGVMRFQAPPGALEWLNSTLFLSSGYREGSTVVLDVEEVL
jgi:Protein of unknown function (DUF3237)